MERLPAARARARTDANDHQNGDGVAQQDQQTVSVVGGDMYSVGFIMILLIRG